MPWQTTPRIPATPRCLLGCLALLSVAVTGLRGAALPAVRADSDRMTLTALADTWMGNTWIEGIPLPVTATHGADPRLLTGFLDVGDFEEEALTLLSFDLSVLPPDRDVATATLHLAARWTAVDAEVAPPLDSAPTTTVHLGCWPWDERTVSPDPILTWCVSEPLAAARIVSGTVAAWDVTAAVRALRAARRPQGLALSTESPAIFGTWAVFASREAGPPPALDVTLAPGLVPRPDVTGTWRYGCTGPPRVCIRNDGNAGAAPFDVAGPTGLWWRLAYLAPGMVECADATVVGAYRVDAADELEELAEDNNAFTIDAPHCQPLFLPRIETQPTSGLPPRR